jgi:hypothetical protein
VFGRAMFVGMVFLEEELLRFVAMLGKGLSCNNRLLV